MKNSILSTISANHAGGTALLALSLIAPVGAATMSPESSGPSFQIPPGTWRVIASHQGTTKKNVLYILDHHATGNGTDIVSKWLDPAGMAAQKSIFKILDDQIRKKWSITLSQEAWSSKPGESKADFIARNLAGFMLTPGLTDGKTRTLDGGYSIAARLAGDSMHQATNLIAAVYGDRVTNIAPMNDRLELEVMKTDLRIGIVKEEIRDERNTCGAISSVPANLSLMEASSGLEYPARSNPCGCGVMTTYSDQFSDWAKDRYQKAAIREVDAVIAGKTLETVIVAGGGHAYHAIKRMREKGIGYQVIMPAGATESLMDIEHDPVETETQKIKKYLACSPKHSKRIPAFDAMVEKKTEQTMIIVRQQFGAIQKK